MKVMKSAGIIVGVIKVWENKICEAFPIKTILVVCIIVVLCRLNAIKSGVNSIEWDVSSIQSEVSSIQWDVSSIESDVSSITMELSFR